MSNPYLTEYELAVSACTKAKRAHSRRDRAAGKLCPDMYQWRMPLVTRYSWAIPNEAALSALAGLGSIVEIGAGLGYWTSLLQQRGVDVVAYDAEPEGNKWCKGTAWCDVLVGGPEKAAEHSDRALFLCWPPFEDPMASQALQYYQGQTVAYIGEGSGGCTADDAFHAALRQDWTLTAEVEIPQWVGMHDSLMIYTRKAV